jgi:hypothetical protein
MADTCISVSRATLRVEPVGLLVLASRSARPDAVEASLWISLLSFVDDFAVASSQGRAASAEDFRNASRLLDRLLARYGLSRQPEKGVWGRDPSAFSTQGS